MTRGPEDRSPPLGGIAHRVAHPRDAFFIHQIDDQLELVETLEVGDLGLVSRFDERLEPGLHEAGGASAQNGLLTEQIRLGLLGERGLDHTRPGAADGIGVGESESLRSPGGILLYRDESRHAAAFHVGAAHEVAGALRGHHAHVDPLDGRDEIETDVESVGEEEGVSLREVGGHVLFVDRGHLGGRA